jgi:hypothetical protein
VPCRLVGNLAGSVASENPEDSPQPITPKATDESELALFNTLLRVGSRTLASCDARQDDQRRDLTEVPSLACNIWSTTWLNTYSQHHTRSDKRRQGAGRRRSRH